MTAITINRRFITGATKQPGLLMRWRLAGTLADTRVLTHVISEMDTKHKCVVCALQVVSLSLFSQITMQTLERNDM